MTQKNGFTLIEVLIVLVILAVLTTLTAQTIQKSAQTKAKLQKGLDQVSAIRNALSVMERDISLAFNYRDPNLEIQEEIKKKQQDPNAPPPPPTPVRPKLTQFQGEKEKLDFTSLANVRTQPNQPVSEQMEVGYQVKSCKSFFRKEPNTKCLFRRTSALIDDKIDEGGDEVALLEGVTSFELKYFGEGKEDWEETWKTGENADDVTKDKFPYAVEIVLEVESPEGKKHKSQTVVQLRFPNNKTKEVKPDGQNPQPPSP